MDQAKDFMATLDKLISFRSDNTNESEDDIKKLFMANKLPLIEAFIRLSWTTRDVRQAEQTLELWMSERSYPRPYQGKLSRGKLSFRVRNKKK